MTINTMLGAMTRRALTIGALAAIMVASAHAAEKVTLKYATFAPAQGFTNSEIIIPFLDRVVADSKGTLDYKVYSGGTLGRNPAEQLKLVQDGVADLAFVIPSYTPGSFETYNVTQLPTLASTTEQASTGLWKAFDEDVLKRPNGAKVVGLFTTAPNVLHVNRKIKGVSDLHSLKIRAAGNVQTNVIEAIGATPVGNIGAPGAAEAISRGVVDGTVMDWVASKSFKVNKVATHHIDYPLGFVAIMIPMNQETWDSLPEPASQAFLKHGGAALAEAAGKAFDKAAVATKKDAIEASGQSVIELNEADRHALKEKLSPVVDQWMGGSKKRHFAVNILRDSTTN